MFKGGIYMKRKGSRLIYIANIAATYTGTIIGAGFASGQEILVFFTRYEKLSYVSLIISTFLFMYIGSKILMMGGELNSKCYAEMTRAVFKGIAPLINIYLLIAYMTISIAMFAGAGTLFGSYYWIGISITSVLAIITIIMGVDGILYANTIIIPLIFVFDILMFVYHLNVPMIDIQNSKELSTSSIINPIKSGLIYSSYNIILCIGVLVPLGNSVENRNIAKLGGYMGGVLIGTILAMSNYCLSVHMPHIYIHEVPLMYIAHKINPIFGWIYTFILWGAIFTTLIGNLFSITSIIEERFPKYLHNTVLICIVVFFVLLSNFGFSTIISTLYPILGSIGLIFVVYIAIYSLG